MQSSQTKKLAEQLVARDRQHIWHPYSSATQHPPLYPIARAEGVRLYLKDGRVLIDGMSSWWSVIHGYNHAELNEAITQQLDKMAHVMFGGLTHEPAVQLAETLVRLTPEGLNRVFFSDSGSVAVEVAIKMVLQYWQSRGQSGKHKLLSLRRGYHGDTFAAMSVCDPDTGMHHLFHEILVQQIFSDSPGCRFDQPWDDAYIQDFETQITSHSEQLAAVILEPIVQGTGGMNFYSPEFLRRVRALCSKHNVLLIADEIATGFGRTGKLFACEHAGISPDILCLGKSLTAGYMTLAATLCTDEIAVGISEGEASVFMHGPTFMANPLACSVALKSCEILEREPWQKWVARLEQVMSKELSPARELPQVADVRVLGGIGVIELKEPITLANEQDKFVQAGIWVRPFGKLVYIMPPFVISELDLTKLCRALVEVVKTIHP
ncbi:adenosylmethionine--8-amino-7-oxononanoate transaminase [Halioxenophilus sp. WMMB6]|uniref:adenosylmethionine--8-amino-7-oxononanoate transaminase n=1 Tax=Halioxenophilus sp. WMMB6 TaxID=3073815 RepID=UPI00295ED08A|nr:adenosylmethionine--8-amino-7-oxononanoate transaminase [Halioxenophilus sp. WMMB6]